jgi:predicted DCC family thiol-disulfide oxidoreductase YuxK
LSEDERNASWHLILDDGTRSSAGAALAPTLALLPGGRILASFFARFPRTTERAYRWVTAHRGLLGRFVPARARRWADRVIAAHGGPEPSQ